MVFNLCSPIIVDCHNTVTLSLPYFGLSQNESAVTYLFALLGFRFTSIEEIVLSAIITLLHL